VNKKVPVVDASKDPNVQIVLGWVLASVDVMPASAQFIMPKMRLIAADWFFDKSLLEEFGKALAANTDVTGLTIDLTPPTGHAGAEDLELLAAFGVGGQAEHRWVEEMVSALVDLKDRLKGVSVVVPPHHAIAELCLTEAGFNVVGEATTVNDLITKPVLSISPTFIENVMGGQKAYEAVLVAMKLSPKGLAPFKPLDTLVVAALGA
jgi:hypothetical protein